MTTVCYMSLFLATHSSNKFCPAARYGLFNQCESRRKGPRPLGTSNVSKSYITGLFRYIHVVPSFIFSIITNFPVGVETMLGGQFIADWGDDGTLWEAWRRTCTPQSSARRLFSSIRGPSSVQAKNHFESSTVNPVPTFPSQKALLQNKIFAMCPMLTIPTDTSSLTGVQYRLLPPLSALRKHKVLPRDGVFQNVRLDSQSLEGRKNT